MRSPVPCALILLLACDGGPIAGPGRPDDATYTGLLTLGTEATAGEIQFRRYTSEAPGCEAREWVETSGLCDMRFAPDTAGFGEIPDEPSWTCRMGDSHWSIAGGTVHVDSSPDDASLQLVVDRACPLTFPLDGAPVRICRDDLFLRVDLTLVERSTSGVLECAIQASPTDDGTCGPGIAGFPCAEDD